VAAVDVDPSRREEYPGRQVLVCACSCGTRTAHPARRRPSRKQHSQEPQIPQVLVLKSLRRYLQMTSGQNSHGPGGPGYLLGLVSIRLKGEIVVDFLATISITIAIHFITGGQPGKLRQHESALQRRNHRAGRKSLFKRFWVSHVEKLLLWREK
jgi:hypothetical protein